ncbi:hypothetical protein AgCh_000986 [Apium graveolens]
MPKKEKEIFCSVLKNEKLPYGCASNISRYVSINEKKVVGYKSHDAHFMLHYLLQFAMRRTLKLEVALPLIKLGTFFRGLWSNVIDLNDLKKLQKDIVDILCRFEMIFIQSLFDIMVHLLVHLCREVEYGGPVQLKSMFPIERFFGKLKSYVRNRSKQEGSIAEGYLAEECVTLCSRFLTGEGETEDTMSYFARNASLEYHIGIKKNQDGKVIKLKYVDWKASHQYVLFNSGNNKIESMIRMDDTAVNVRLHHEGKFKKTSYVGGKHFIVIGLDVESFSYSMLMELVKDNLHFTEIGGIYANRGRKDGWQLLSNDKQVTTLVEDCAPASPEKPLKRNENEKVTARRKLALEQWAGDVEDTGNKDIVEKLPPPSPLPMFLKRNMEKVKKARCRGDADKMLPPPPPLCKYEKLKLDKMRANIEVYKSLGLPQIVSTFKNAVESSSKSKGKKGKETAIEEDDSQYVPANKGDVESDDSSEVYVI